VAFDPRFWPAFFNLLNNAAEAGGGEVELSVASSDGWLTLQIRNRRGSLSPAQLARAGLAPLDSSKPAGLGLGVMLSHVTLSHLGGELNLDNDPQGGVCATLRLPLDTP
jgi:two-component system sensor histidine kinase RegB